MQIGVKAQTMVQVKMSDVLQAWLDNFLSELPMPDLIEELSIDPETKRPMATWNLGTEEEPSLHVGSVDVSCKDVIMYGMVAELLGICEMPSSDKAFLAALTRQEGEMTNEG